MSAAKDDDEGNSAVWSALFLAVWFLLRMWPFWLPVAFWLGPAGWIGRSVFAWLPAVGGLAALAFAALLTVPVAWWCWVRQVPRTVRAESKRRLRRDVVAALEAVGLADEDRPALVVSLEETAAGRAVEIELAPGFAIADVERQADALADALRVEAVEVTRPRPGVECLLLRERDPLTNANQPPWPLLAALNAPRSLTQPIPVALLEDGSTRALDIWCSSVLIGGQPGAGKSASALWPLVCGAALDPLVQLFVVDAKGGVELDVLNRAGRAEMFATGQEAAVEMMQRLLHEVIRRQEALRRQALRKIPPDSEQLPPLVLVVDELAEVTASGDKVLDDEANTVLRRLLNVGRALGLTVLCATQKPSSEVISTGARDAMAWRWALRTGNRASSVVILGDDAVSNGAAPHAIPRGREHAGIGYLAAEAGGAERCRGYYLTDDAVEAAVASAAEMHARLGVRMHLEAPPVDDNDEPRPKRRRRR